MSSLKTYSHLEALGRKPTEYEISTTRMLYHGGTVELDATHPVAQWYQRYRHDSALKGSDWDNFRDPRETFYRRYCDRRDRAEVFIDGLLAEIEDTGSDLQLSEGWLAVLRRAYTPRRFPQHGLQMATSYLGSMAPGGRIQFAAAFQAADVMREIQRLAYRCKQLDHARGDFGHTDLASWENDPIWQPLRRCVESLLVTYDWGECFAALCLTVKPRLDMLFLEHFSALARSNGDHYTAEINFSLNDSGRWHREWAAELARTAINDTPQNKQVLGEWIDKWTGPADDAVEGLRPVFAELAPVPADFDAITDTIRTDIAAWHSTFR